MATCHYCPAPATTKDHVIPRAMGGPNTTWNLVPACASCNKAKGSLTYEAFTGRDQLPLRTVARGFGTTRDFLDRFGHFDVEVRRVRARIDTPKLKRRSDHAIAFVADLRYRPRGGW